MDETDFSVHRSKPPMILTAVNKKHHQVERELEQGKQAYRWYVDWKNCPSRDGQTATVGTFDTEAEAKAWISDQVKVCKLCGERIKTSR